eukprot:scaffold148760_cov19-Tisochrysis_lutea.AAC.1
MIANQDTEEGGHFSCSVSQVGCCLSVSISLVHEAQQTPPQRPSSQRGAAEADKEVHESLTNISALQWLRRVQSFASIGDGSGEGCKKTFVSRATK